MIRAKIRQAIDAYVQNFVGKKDSQNIEFPYSPNTDELLYLTNKINAARAAADSDDYERVSIRVGGVDVSTTNPVPVDIVDATGVVISVQLDWTNDSVEARQDIHDRLNGNANIQVGDADVGAANPVPVSDAGGSLTVDQATHDNLNGNANVQQGNADVGAGNKLHVQSSAAADFLNTEVNSGAIQTAVETIDNIVGTEGSDVATGVAIVGSKAVDGVPDELAEDEDGSFWMTTWKELVLFGANLAERSIDVTWDPVPPMRVTGITQLTAPGSTTPINVADYSDGCYGFTVANINTNVVVRVEGTIDGTNWFNMAATDTTITANGTYRLDYSARSVYQVRFTFVSEAGGAAATIDCDFIARA
jgi:hypothetical protein